MLGSPPIIIGTSKKENAAFDVIGSYSNNLVFVRFDASNGEQYVISLYDVSEKRMYSEMYISGSEEHVGITLPVEKLNAGMYLIQVESGSKSGNQKVIIE